MCLCVILFFIWFKLDEHLLWKSYITTKKKVVFEEKQFNSRVLIYTIHFYNCRFWMLVIHVFCMFFSFLAFFVSSFFSFLALDEVESSDFLVWNCSNRWNRNNSSFQAFFCGIEHLKIIRSSSFVCLKQCGCKLLAYTFFFDLCE